MLSLDKQNQFRELYRQQNPGWRPATEVYAGLVRQHIQPHTHLLDLGCGRGGLVEQLEHPLAQVVGVDPDWVSLVEHRLVMPRAAAHSQALPFTDNSFDLVMCSWVLEHMPDPAKDLAEISRILKPGGVFIFITPNKQHPLIQINRFITRFTRVQDRLVNWLYGRAAADTFPAYYRANSRRELEELAAAANLHLPHLQTVTDPTYLAFTPTLFHLLCHWEKQIKPEKQIHLVGCLESSAKTQDN